MGAFKIRGTGLTDLNTAVAFDKMKVEINPAGTGFSARNIRYRKDLEVYYDSEN